jgi:hypothetical protein
MPKSSKNFIILNLSTSELQRESFNSIEGKYDYLVVLSQEEAGFYKTKIQ